jgi:hypothetical protein
MLMVSVMHPNLTQIPLEVKSLASVILRRNISTSMVDSSDVKDVANNANLWQRLSDDARNFVKRQILETLSGTLGTQKHLTHKVCSLAVEI